MCRMVPLPRAVGVLAVAGALVLPAGCGDSGCLTQAEINQKVNEIALGFEASSSEAEAKQEEIREIRERACH